MSDNPVLSELVISTVENIFPPQEHASVLQILNEECTTKLPLAHPESYERIQLAVLKISAGKTDQLLEAVRLAQTDWRDVLMWAEFGTDLEAHLNWAGKVCRRCEG